MAEPLRYFVVNAFTSRAFTGNPATVVMVPQKFLGDSDSEVYAAYFQKLAGEVSSVETAFVLPPDQPKTDYRLRFFTKSKETTFCGHAAIAAAHVLSTEFNFPSDHIYFSTKSGVVVVKCTNRKQFELDLHPTLPTRVAPLDTADGQRAVWTALKPALYPPVEGHGGAADADPAKVAIVAPIEIVYHEPSQNLILSFSAVSPILLMKPNSLKLMESVAGALNGVAVLKVTVTAVAAPPAPTSPTSVALAVADAEQPWRKYDFVTRLFAPWIGIAEDAVSGATHAILAQYWRQAAAGKLLRDKRSLICFQPSTRGGEIVINVHGERVGIAGEAVTVCAGCVNSATSKM